MPTPYTTLQTEEEKKFDAFWGESPEGTAKHSMRESIKEQMRMRDLQLIKIIKAEFVEAFPIHQAIAEERARVVEEMYIKGFKDGFEYSAEGFNGEYRHPDVPENFLVRDAKEAFLATSIHQAIAEERERVVEEMKTTSLWKACEDYFTPEQREFFLAYLEKPLTDKE